MPAWDGLKEIGREHHVRLDTALRVHPQQQPGKHKNPKQRVAQHDANCRFQKSYPNAIFVQPGTRLEWRQWYPPAGLIHPAACLWTASIGPDHVMLLRNDANLEPDGIFGRDRGIAPGKSRLEDVRIE